MGSQVNSGADTFLMVEIEQMARGDRCKTCRSPQRALIDTLLSEGHSPSCITWHLIRLGQRVPPTSIESHCEVHLHRPVPRGDHGLPRWRFTPYFPPPVEDNEAPELLLIRGLPGVGKTNLARTYGATHAHVEADLFFANRGGSLEIQKDGLPMAHRWCQSWAFHVLLGRCNVVVANTFSQEWELTPYLAIAIVGKASLRVLELPDVLIQPLLSKVEYRARQMRRRWEPLSVPTEMVERPSDDASLPDISFQCQPGLCPLGPSYVDYVERVSTKIL